MVDVFTPKRISLDCPFKSNQRLTRKNGSIEKILSSRIQHCQTVQLLFLFLQLTQTTNLI